MFGAKNFILHTIFLWTIICVILVESKRVKKDVHHMIILQDEVPIRAKRHRNNKNHIHSSHRSKRKPSRPHKHKYSSSSEESVEDLSYEEYIPPPKPKTKRQHHKPTHHPQKHHKPPKDHKPSKDHDKEENHWINNHNVKKHHKDSYYDAKWTSVSSQELYAKASSSKQPIVFPGAYQNGVYHYSQPVPIEITTHHPVVSNSFLRFESTLYPPLSSGYDTQPQVGTVEAYKPFDYSIFEQQPHNYVSNPGYGQDIVGNGANEANSVTPLSILMDGSTENAGDNSKSEERGKNSKKSKNKRTRGTSRFRIK